MNKHSNNQPMTLSVSDVLRQVGFLDINGIFNS